MKLRLLLQPLKTLRHLLGLEESPCFRLPKKRLGRGKPSSKWGPLAITQLFKIHKGQASLNKTIIQPQTTYKVALLKFKRGLRTNRLRLKAKILKKALDWILMSTIFKMEYQRGREVKLKFCRELNHPPPSEDRCPLTVRCQSPRAWLLWIR